MGADKQNFLGVSHPCQRRCLKSRLAPPNEWSEFVFVECSRDKNSSQSTTLGQSQRTYSVTLNQSHSPKTPADVFNNSWLKTGNCERKIMNGYRERTKDATQGDSSTMTDSISQAVAKGFCSIRSLIATQAWINITNLLPSPVLAPSPSPSSFFSPFRYYLYLRFILTLLLLLQHKQPLLQLLK